MDIDVNLLFCCPEQKTSKMYILKIQKKVESFPFLIHSSEKIVVAYKSANKPDQTYERYFVSSFLNWQALNKVDSIDKIKLPYTTSL